MESTIKWQDGPVPTKDMWKRYLAIVENFTGAYFLVEIYVDTDLHLTESKQRVIVDQKQIIKWAEIPEVPEEFKKPEVINKTEITWYSPKTPPKTTGFYHVLLGGLGYALIERKQYLASTKTWLDTNPDLYIVGWTDLK